MAIEVLTLAEARRSHLPGVIALHQAAWGRVVDLREYDQMARAGFPWTPYQAVFAVEGDDVLSGVYTSRYPFVTPDGPEAATGIETVMTRPDAKGRGLASRLLDEVHRRERADGLRLSLLWTGRSNRAYDLYRRLGYRDLYRPRSSLRYVGRAPPVAPTDVRVRPATRADAEVLERLHRRANAGRLGFARRFPHSFRTRFLVRQIRPDQVLLAERRGRPVGYATAEVNLRSARARELVSPSPDVRASLRRAVEHRTPRRWVVYSDAWFRGPADPVLARGTPLLEGYAVMMALPLARGLPSTDLVRWLGVGGPGFACQALDFF